MFTPLPVSTNAFVSPKETFYTIYISLTSNKFYGNFMIVEDKKNRNKVWVESFHIEPRQGFARADEGGKFLLNNNKLVYNFNSINDASRRKVFASTDEWCSHGRKRKRKRRLKVFSKVSNGKKVLKKVDKVTFDAQGKSCFFHGIILCSLSVMLHRITRVKGKFIFTLSRDYMIFVTSRTRNRTGIVCHWEHLSRWWTFAVRRLRTFWAALP